MEGVSSFGGARNDDHVVEVLDSEKSIAVKIVVHVKVG